MLRVVHEGIDTRAVAPDPNVRLRVPGCDRELTINDEILTYVARNLEPYRGFTSFMRSLPSILTKRPNARVLAVKSRHLGIDTRGSQNQNSLNSFWKFKKRTPSPVRRGSSCTVAPSRRAPNTSGANISTQGLDNDVHKPVDKCRFGKKSKTLLIAHFLTTRAGKLSRLSRRGGDGELATMLDSANLFPSAISGRRLPRPGRSYAAKDGR